MLLLTVTNKVLVLVGHSNSTADAWFSQCTFLLPVEQVRCWGDSKQWKGNPPFHV